MRPALYPVLFGRPGWAPYGASLAFDFTKGAGWTPHSVRPAAGMLTTTRASDGYADNNAGVWQVFTSGQPRITDKGLLVEEARTNVVLYNRDLTNAAWTPTNVDAAKDQTGVDGVANSASSITATDANATILQAITLASSARFQTAFVKRITGTGTVEMTMDNGSTWTAVTVTAGWTRVSIPTQTLANPTVGFRIVTSGDAIAVDFVQNENGTFSTSPIAVTTVAATRAADVVSISNFSSWFVAGPATLFTEAVLPVDTGVQRTLVAITDASVNSNSMEMQVNASDVRGATAYAATVLVATVTAGGVVTYDSVFKLATAFAADDFQAATAGSLGTPDTSGALPGSLDRATLGRRVNSAFPINGYIPRGAYFPTRLANAQLSALIT